MAITVGGLTVDKYITTPTYRDAFRARSCEYTIDGTAREDRLGQTKKRLELTFAMLPANVHNSLRTILQQKEITVSGFIGSVDTINVGGKYRFADNEIPTPVLVVHGGKFYCQPFTVNLEEI